MNFLQTTVPNKLLIFRKQVNKFDVINIIVQKHSHGWPEVIYPKNRAKPA